MRTGNFQFQPRFVPTLATVILLPMLISLGFWQLDRADQKRTLHSIYEKQALEPPIALESARRAPETLRYRRVVVAGRYDGAHQILLDNQIHRGRPGYHVFTPLRMTENGVGILVNRGWIALGNSRSDLPVVPTPDAPVAVRGMVDKLPDVGLRLARPREELARWPRVVQYLDTTWLEAELGYQVLPYVVSLDGEDEHGFIREWAPTGAGRGTFGPEKHVAYAVQWFALALALVIIFVVVNVRRHEESGGG